MPVSAVRTGVKGHYDYGVCVCINIIAGMFFNGRV